MTVMTGARGCLQRLVVVVAVVEHRLQLELFLLTGLDEEHLGADLEREQLHLLVGQRHRGGDHLAVLQEEADDVGRGAVQLGGELLRRHAALDDDRALGDGGVAGGVVASCTTGCMLVEVATTTSTTLLARRTALAVRDAGHRHLGAGHRGHHRDHRRAPPGPGRGATEAATGTLGAEPPGAHRRDLPDAGRR